MKKDIIKNLFFHIVNIGFIFIISHIFFLGERYLHTINHRLYMTSDSPLQTMIYTAFQWVYVIGAAALANWMFYSKKFNHLYIFWVEIQLAVTAAVALLIVIANKLSFYWCL